MSLLKGFIAPLVVGEQGRVVKYTGDGVIAEFLSVIKAMACAVAIQKGPYRNKSTTENHDIALRIGINVGSILVEDDDVFGTSVNIAVRLQALAQAGDIYLSKAAYDAARDKVDHDFQFCGEYAVKNIPDLVSVYRIVSDRHSEASFEAISSVSDQKIDTNQQQHSLAPELMPFRATVAVLPFDNLAGESPRWERFTMGICEDIITNLARHADLSVIARTSVVAIKSRSLDIRQIGRELGVRYVLEGSIQTGINQIRITAQLIDARTGIHVWAERFDRSDTDLLSIQDNIVQQVAGSLIGWEGHISRDVRRQARTTTSPNNLVAYERYLLAYEAESKMTRTSTERAIQLAESALALDPMLARAWLILGYAWEHKCLFGWAEDILSAQQIHRESISRAYELDPTDAAILMNFGDLVSDDGDASRACSIFENAVRLSANRGDTLALLAKYVVGSLGRREQALWMMKRAYQLNPIAPPLYFYNQLRIDYLCEKYGDAIAAASRSPDTPVTKLFLAMSLARLGHQADSEDITRQLRTEVPEFDPVNLASAPWLLDPEANAMFCCGLREIGFDPSG